MTFKALCSELSLASVLVEAFKSELTCNFSPYCWYVDKTVKHVIGKLCEFIRKLYKFKRKQKVCIEPLCSSVTNCVKLLEEFVDSLKGADLSALPNLYYQIMQLTENYAKLLVFQSKCRHSALQVIDYKHKLTCFLNGLATFSIRIQVEPHHHSPVILIRLCTHPTFSASRQISGKCDITENKNCVNLESSFVVPETPPRCPHQPACNGMTTVRGMGSLSWRRLFPMLAPVRPVRLMSGRWTISRPTNTSDDELPQKSNEYQAGFQKKLQNKLCSSLSTDCVDERQILSKKLLFPKRPLPTVFMVTDSLFSPPKKPKTVENVNCVLTGPKAWMYSIP
ncbi:uncharacterized protein LOC130699297 [Daphnia carinata]|uniref:uncharacterized protein LOC130699297 n=1 Tax=Daphnia carinata TaxID=120202 RepID=UPI002579B844|nr:uncharacterized protein LOC130699297 [Daphnia carinata]